MFLSIRRRHREATPEQRTNWKFSGAGYGIPWPRRRRGSEHEWAAKGDTGTQQTSGVTFGNYMHCNWNSVSPKGLRADVKFNPHGVIVIPA